MRAEVLGTIVLAGILLAACNSSEPPERPKITNPTCEDLGKITDDAEHAALWAKCPDYLRNGTKRSKPKEW